jgi:hypothetical protein
MMVFFWIYVRRDNAKASAAAAALLPRWSASLQIRKGALAKLLVAHHLVRDAGDLRHLRYIVNAHNVRSA